MQQENKKATFEIDPRYQEMLERQAIQTSIIRAQLALPPLQAGQLERLQKHLPGNAVRLINFIFEDHQGARTDAIRSACSIGNVSDCAIRQREHLKALGLSLRCQEVRSLNRYGQKTVIGLWWLTIADPEKWGSFHATSEAANDPEF
jgi:hypothetical protein